tara:strand:- start:609 stop:1043 length:435 start_codon:yes stop_codon:yes gene_type:complete
MNEIERSLKAAFKDADVVVGTKDKPIVTDSEMLPIKHYFMDGVYVREMIMNPGMLVVGAIHKHRHMCFLLQGHLSVASDSGITDYIAPCIIVANPGERRVLYAHEHSVWYNTHKNPSNTEDVDQLEKDIVATSYEEYEQYIKNK